MEALSVTRDHCDQYPDAGEGIAEGWRPRFDPKCLARPAAQPAASELVDGPSAPPPPGAPAASCANNYKSLLSARMARELRRTVEPGDIVYGVSRPDGPPFAATVTLARLPGAGAPPIFTGGLFPRVKEAQQDAARLALEFLTARASAPARPARRADAPAVAAALLATAPAPLDHPAPAPVQAIGMTEPPGGAPLTAMGPEGAPLPAQGNLPAGPAAAGAAGPQRAAAAAEEQEEGDDAPCCALLRGWCQGLGLPEALRVRLEDEEVEEPALLAELAEADLERLSEGLKAGPKAKFLKAVRSMRGPRT